MKCPKCGGRTRVVEARDAEFVNARGSRPKCLRVAREAAAHYTLDFYARTRKCTTCQEVHLTIELLTDDLLQGWSPVE